MAVASSIKSLLSALSLAGIKPRRIVATAQGGISLWFAAEGRKVQFEVSNDDPYTALLVADHAESE